MLTVEPASKEAPTPARYLRSPAEEDEKWEAVLARSRESDESFVFAVRSTGVYCRPSCPARHPKREHVAFYLGPDEAELSGFRPCMRCRPRDPIVKTVDLVNRVRKYVDIHLDEKLTLSSLSIVAGISPFHLQRTFKRAFGVSPRQYVEARRLARVKLSLKNGETVTNAIYNAGFTSKSRLYEKTSTPFGTNLGVLRRGGKGLRIEYTIISCSLGRALVASTERGICFVCMGDSDEAVEAALSEDYPLATLHRNDEGMSEYAIRFQNYFSGQQLPSHLPVDVQATVFQWKVWKEIQSIPYGNTTTYSRIAKTLKKPRAARAVARACAANPVPLVIPCHRVIGEDGGLHGYRWDIERKQALLSLEKKPNSENS